MIPDHQDPNKPWIACLIESAWEEWAGFAQDLPEKLRYTEEEVQIALARPIPPGKRVRFGGRALGPTPIQVGDVLSCTEGLKGFWLVEEHHPKPRADTMWLLGPAGSIRVIPFLNQQREHALLLRHIDGDRYYLANGTPVMVERIRPAVTPTASELVAWETL